jgi:hypothetical protein
MRCRADVPAFRHDVSIALRLRKTVPIFLNPAASIMSLAVISASDAPPSYGASQGFITGTCALS